VTTQYLVTKERSNGTILAGISTFAPGASVPLHTHNCRELVVVLEGEADVEIELDGERRHSVGAGDATWIGPDTEHRFTNRGDRTMRILWVYTATGADRTIVATGRRTIIGSPEDRA
jgi:putative monooxygenase